MCEFFFHFGDASDQGLYKHRSNLRVGHHFLEEMHMEGVYYVHLHLVI